MNSKRIALAVLLSVVIAAVVTYGFYARLRAQQAQSCAVVKVIAAAKNMEAGSPIGNDSIVLIDWPASMPSTGLFTKPDDLVGRSLIYPISEHQPIRDRDVAMAGSGIGLTVKIPEGMRAVSVRSNDVVGVAGFLYPGSHVDVLVTSKMDAGKGETGSPRTQTILANVEVLTAGQKIEPDPTGKPEAVNVVTLLLKPEDSEKLVLASSQGSIQFVLRNGADRQTPDTKSVDMVQLMNKGIAPITPVPTTKRVTVKTTPSPVKQAVYYEVETISGTKRSVDKFE